MKALENREEINWLLKSNLPDSDLLQILTRDEIYIAVQITRKRLKSKLEKKINYVKTRTIEYGIISNR